MTTLIQDKQDLLAYLSNEKLKSDRWVFRNNADGFPEDAKSHQVVADKFSRWIGVVENTPVDAGAVLPQGTHAIQQGYKAEWRRQLQFAQEVLNHFGSHDAANDIASILGQMFGTEEAGAQGEPQSPDLALGSSTDPRAGTLAS